VSVLLGNGDGLFQAAVNFGVGTYPNQVAVGDLNSDGNLDLVTANEDSHNLSVLRGNGDGTFQPALNFSGDNPVSVAVGGFNGDGKLDLASTNYNSHSVSVLLNTCVSVPNTPTPPVTNTPTRTRTPTNAPASPTNTAAPSQTPGGATATPNCTTSFTDVGTSNIFYTDILFLACRGVISGFPNGDGTFRFEPNSNTTRGQFAKIATLGFALPAFTPATPTFSDVPSNNVFYQFVEAAAHAGAITGFSDSTFRPNQNVTRAQVAIITLRARGYTILTPTNPTFSDVPNSNFAYAAIETLAARGIINGAACSGSQCFRPNDNVRRGELSKVVRRATESQLLQGNP